MFREPVDALRGDAQVQSRSVEAGISMYRASEAGDDHATAYDTAAGRQDRAQDHPG